MPQKTLITSDSGLGRQILDVLRAGLNSSGLLPDEAKYLATIGHRLKAETRQMIERLAVGMPTSHEVARGLLGANFFGIKDWQRHYDISFTKSQLAKVSQFPWGEKVLTAPCPFNADRQVKDTHFAFLGVEQYGKKPLTIRQWQEVHPASGQPRFYAYQQECWYTNEPFANEVTCQLRWYLCLKEIVPQSENKTFDQHQAMLPAAYEVPTSVAEVTKHIVCFKKTGSYLNPTRYGRVQDTSSDGGRVNVGRSGAWGLDVFNCWDGLRWHALGVSASRKLDT